MRIVLGILVLFLLSGCSKDYRTDSNGKTYFLKICCADMTCTETVVDTIYID
jgi:hypothetical protein